MANTHKAGCACGAVQLEITGDPTAQVYCHCSSCRGWLGAPIHAAALWPTAQVRVVRGQDRLGVFKRPRRAIASSAATAARRCWSAIRGWG